MYIDSLLTTAHKIEASDVHISVGIPPVFRVNGKLEQLTEYETLYSTDTENIAKELLTEEQFQYLEKTGEIDFSYAVHGEGRFRINVYKQRGSYSIAVRPIPLTIPSAENLGLPSVVKKMSNRTRGLILVTGPTGAGKSTTLATMVDNINKTRRAHILTLEDPIEYLHAHDKCIVNQREIGNDSKSYNNALRAALRQDPDVILIGEMRDLETISIAVTAAETGHLVLATLHTTGAVSTVDRIIDVFPSNQQQQIKAQLSSVLVGVISQQLVRKKDGSGRIGAFEVMICNQAIRNLIREGKTHQIMSSIQTGKKLGMISMDSFLADLYNQDKISLDDAMFYCVDKDYMRRIL